MLVNTLFENKVEQLYDVTQRLASALEGVGIPYQIVGGFAIFSHIDAVDPLIARLTRDVDITVDRGRLQEIAAAVESAGFRYRHVDGVDMLGPTSAIGGSSGDPLNLRRHQYGRGR